MEKIDFYEEWGKFVSHDRFNIDKSEFPALLIILWLVFFFPGIIISVAIVVLYPLQELVILIYRILKYPLSKLFKLGETK